MSYRIAQSEEYLGGDYWKWSAWVEAVPDELDQLEFVSWILHPTFSPSRVEIRSRATQFRLDTSGWGTFLLRAELHRKGTDPLSISRMLRLTYPNDEEAMTSAASSVPSVRKVPSKGLIPTVFLSYSSEDESQAQRIRQSVERLGARVLDSRSVRPGLPMDAAIRKMIRESDGLMSVIGSDFTSPNVLLEIKLAKLEEKPVVALLTEDLELPPSLTNEVQNLRLGGDSGALDSILAGFVGKLASV